MRNTTNKKQTHPGRALISVIITFVLAFGSFVGVIYAWFIVVYKVSDNTLQTGELTPALEIQYWDKSIGVWLNISAAGSGHEQSFYPNFGEMNNIAELPEDCNIYLKLRVNDTSGAVYKYNVFVSDIGINIFDFEKDLFDENNLLDTGDDDAIVLDYYDSQPSQKCFDYYYFTSDENGLDPGATDAFTDDGISLDERNQALSEEFIPENEWLYVKVEPSLAEFQNILKCIPSSYMPYRLGFLFSLTGESRTV